MLAFDRPWLLVLALAGPGLHIARFLFRSKIGTLALPFPDAEEGLPAAPLIRRIARATRQVALILALAACAAAAAGPAVVDRKTIFFNRGGEIVFILDLSPSMAAADLEPTRLEAAKAILKKFVAARRNESLGLVAFGSEAALICPPTMDYDSLVSRVESLVPGLYGEGSALGSGIATGLVHASRSAAAEKHLVLLTDGESNAGPVDPLTAAMAAARAGIDLTIIGLGSSGEAALVYTDPLTGKRRSGTYLSGFDSHALERLASAGGGRFFEAENEGGLIAAFEELSRQSLFLARSRKVSSERSLSLPILAIALLALVLSRVLGLLGGGGRP
jgi:Ca-activated chloride channel family protein